MPKAKSLKHVCKRSYNKKYTLRNSPAYPANTPGCRGLKKMGNDGKFYISKKFSRKGAPVFRWVKMTK